MSVIPRNVLAIIGTGGMGLAAARRLAAGRTVFLADASESNLAAAAKSLRDDGHSNVHTQLVDVSDYNSVRAFAAAAASSSPGGTSKIETIVHTAGLSPVMAPPERILQVDLLGTANVIDAFSDFVGAGSSLTCIASIARFGAAGLMTPALAEHLSSAPRETLLTANEKLVAKLAGNNPATAYALSKAANLLRVQAAARSWGAKGARINTVSPGVIFTAMLHKEMQGPSKEAIEGMLAGTPLQRGGAADEVASVVAFLAGGDASYVTGADVVVDGGFIAGNSGEMARAAAAAVEGHKKGE